MKAFICYFLCIVGLTAANHIRDIENGLERVLSVRDTTRLVARTGGQRGGRGRSPLREPSPPTAVLSAQGPAKLFANGPGTKSTQVVPGQWKQVTSYHPTNPYVDGRVLGEAEKGPDDKEKDTPPLRAMSKGKSATAQVTVPQGGEGTLHVKNSEGSRTIHVPGPGTRKAHILSDQPGGAKAFASSTRPGAVNADAE